MITLFTRQKEENIDPVFDRSAWPAGTTISGEYNTYAQQVVIHTSGDIAEVEKTQKWIEGEQGEIQQVKIQAKQPRDLEYLQGINSWGTEGSYFIIANGESTITLNLFSTASQIELAIKSLPSIFAEGGDKITVTNLTDPIESQADLLSFTIEFDEQLGKQNLVEVVADGFIGQGVAEQESGIDDWILWGPISDYKTNTLWQWTEIDEFELINVGEPPVDVWIAVANYSNDPYVSAQVNFVRYSAGVDTQPATTTVTYYDNGEYDPETDSFPNPIEKGTVITTRTASLTEDGLDVQITSEITGTPPESYDYSETVNSAEIPVSTIESLARTAIATRKTNYKNDWLKSIVENNGGVTQNSTTAFGESLSGTGRVVDTKLEGTLSEMAWEGKWMTVLSVNDFTTGENISRKLVVLDFDIINTTNLAAGNNNFYLDLDDQAPGIGEGEICSPGWSYAIPGTPDLYYPGLGLGGTIVESLSALDYNSVLPSPAYSALGT